jgi:hypothetical protein
MAKAKRKVGRPRAVDPLNQKVTARFSDDEYAALLKLGEDRDERLSALVRSVVRDTLDEVRKTLKRRTKR